MEIDISGRHFKVTPGLKEHIEAKIRKISKYSLKVESLHVVLEVQKHRQIVEITLLAKNLRLVCKKENTDMYAAIDGCCSSVELQLARKHDRVRDHKGRRYGVKEKTSKKEAAD